MHVAENSSHETFDAWRIVLALAGKDIVDAVKNKTTLTLILGLALMVLMVETRPLLLKLDQRPRVAIHDAARTGLADQLRRAGSVQVLEVPSMTDAQNAAREAGVPLVAIALPVGWENSKGALTVDGYVAHAIAGPGAERLAAQAGQALGAIGDRPVTVELQTVYPTTESGGYVRLVAMGFILGPTLITVTLVPHLILEEKRTHTLEVLRVSPATITHLLLGKGLAGAVYGLLAASILLAFNLPMVNLWGLMLPALLGITLFGAGLGLLVGALVESEGAVQMWVAMVVIILMFPLILSFFGGSRLPEWIPQYTRWLPTVASFDLVRLSFGDGWSVAEVWSQLTAILVAVVVVFAAAGWRLQTREGE